MEQNNNCTVSFAGKSLHLLVLASIVKAGKDVISMTILLCAYMLFRLILQMCEYWNVSTCAWVQMNRSCMCLCICNPVLFLIFLLPVLLVWISADHHNVLSLTRMTQTQNKAQTLWQDICIQTHQAQNILASGLEAER